MLLLSELKGGLVAGCQVLFQPLRLLLCQDKCANRLAVRLHICLRKLWKG